MSSSKPILPRRGGQTRREFVKVAGAAAGATVVLAKAPRVLGQEEPIRIGASLSLPGKYARTGEEEHRGYQLWVEHINEFGHSLGKADLPNTSAKGLLGRPVELIVLDDRSDPTTGVRLYNELIYNQEVDLLLGPYSSAVTNAVAPVIEQAQIPTPNPMASSTDIWTGRNLQWQVQIQPPASKRLPGLTEPANAHGDETIAIVYEDTEFPRNSAAAIRERAKQDGMRIVHDAAYPTKITDWTPIVEQASGVRRHGSRRRRLSARRDRDHPGGALARLQAPDPVASGRRRPARFRADARPGRPDRDRRFGLGDHGRLPGRAGIHRGVSGQVRHLDLALACGIDTVRVRMLAFGIGAALAAAAGTIISMTGFIYPNMGFEYLVKAFTIVVLGGLGSATGALIAAFIYGLLESAGTYLLSARVAQALPFVILVAILTLRPSGLFGTSVDR